MGLKRRASSEPKTTPTGASPAAFIAKQDEGRRGDCEALVKLMSAASGERPVMWGPSIVGFGSYHYKYASGREGDWPRTGFSPRKGALTIYCMPGFAGHGELLKKLGPHRKSVSCLYIKKLDDIDLKVLSTLIERSLAELQEIYDARTA